MECIRHEGRAAVAACSKCGKFLCKECAEKHTPYTLCNECYDALVEKEMRSRKHCFIGAVILGAPMLLLALLALVVFEKDGIMGTILYLIEAPVFIAWFAGFPYGWRAFNRMFARAHYRNFIVTFLVKYFFSWFIGGPCMVYHALKYGIRKEGVDIIV